MSEEPEQIGPLQFIPNPDYPYPFDVPMPPRFWMEEQTGALAEAVELYFQGDAVDNAQLKLIQIYLKQYLERAVMTGDAPRQKLVTRIQKLRSTRQIEEFVDELAEWGVEPF